MKINKEICTIDNDKGSLIYYSWDNDIAYLCKLQKIYKSWKELSHKPIRF